jgi:hypothetical protein
MEWGEVDCWEDPVGSGVKVLWGAAPSLRLDPGGVFDRTMLGVVERGVQAVPGSPRDRCLNIDSLGMLMKGFTDTVSSRNKPLGRDDSLSNLSCQGFLF